MIKTIRNFIKKNFTFDTEFENDLITLSRITGINDLEKLSGKIAAYQMTIKQLIKFYSITGGFPTFKEDKSIYENNFDDWYSLSNLICENKEPGEALRNLINNK